MVPARFRAGPGEQGHEQGDLALCLSLEGGIAIPTSEDLSGLICCTLVAFRPQSLDTRRLGPSPVPLMASTSPPPHTTPHLSGTSQNRDSKEMVHRLASVGEQRSFLQHTTLPCGHLALLLPAPWTQIGAPSTLGWNSGTSTLGIYAHSAWRTQCPSTSDVCLACSRTSRFTLGEWIHSLSANRFQHND